MANLIGRGHMVMCSDFSLKALIKSWGAEHKSLGPNPFSQVGTFSDKFEIAFEAKTLANCPSTQLQKVADLAPEGKAELHAMGSTIVYSLDKSKADTSSYACEVLSIVPRAGSFGVAGVDKKLTHKIGDVSGVCGHVLLSYPNGGKLLTSAGHWIELVKLDVTEEALIRVAKEEYGQAYFDEMQSEMDACGSDMVQRKQVVQSRACRMVQSSAPMEYSKGYGRSKAGYMGKVRSKA
jgi:hypothetical protein